MKTQNSEIDSHWKQFDQAIELYKFYFKITIQVHLFFYGITGAILTFYFANSQKVRIFFALHVKDPQIVVAVVTILSYGLPIALLLYVFSRLWSGRHTK